MLYNVVAPFFQVDGIASYDCQGGYSQNFLRKFVKISVTFGLYILSFLGLKVLFKAKFDVVYCKVIKYLFFMFNWLLNPRLSNEDFKNLTEEIL
jgi:hypothetical protein